MNAMDDPSILWDIYCAEQEAYRRMELEDATCSQCKHYNAVPDDWSRVECGWCDMIGDFICGDESVEDCEDNYESRY